MLPATSQEKDSVQEYFLSQSRDAKITFLQKVYSEAIVGHLHDVWDVHANDRRWWVITNPMNLYSQNQFPNLDLAVTFHVGLCLRIPRTQEQRKLDNNVAPFQSMAVKLAELSDALREAQNVADYQAIGMRSREALLAFVGAAQDIAEWTNDPAPRRADFRGWTELICNKTLAGANQKERRVLIKSLLGDAWAFANWLTHAQSATWHDAEAAYATTENAVGLATSLVLRYIRSVPEECPSCGSPHLFPQAGRRSDQPDVMWERPVCDDCGWTGLPVAIGELPAEKNEQSETTNISEVGDDCVVPTVPLTELTKPKLS